MIVMRSTAKIYLVTLFNINKHCLRLNTNDTPNRISSVIATTITNKRSLRDARFAIGIHCSSLMFSYLDFVYHAPKGRYHGSHSHCSNEAEDDLLYHKARLLTVSSGWRYRHCRVSQISPLVALDYVRTSIRVQDGRLISSEKIERRMDPFSDRQISSAR